jgi:hypothetical protein
MPTPDPIVTSVPTTTVTPDGRYWSADQTIGTPCPASVALVAALIALLAVSRVVRSRH